MINANESRKRIAELNWQKQKINEKKILFKNQLESLNEKKILLKNQLEFLEEELEFTELKLLIEETIAAGKTCCDLDFRLSIRNRLKLSCHMDLYYSEVWSVNGSMISITWPKD